MDIKHGYQPKELLRRRPLEETREYIEAERKAGRKAGREAARKDFLELLPKLLWLQAAISAIALILSIVALLLRL